MSEFHWFAWLIAFGGVATVFFLVTDSAQRFLYDEVVSHLGIRILAAALPYSFLLLLVRPEIGAFQSMLLMCIAHMALLFPGIWLILRFQWPHALGMAALIGGIAYPILWIAMDRFVTAT